jgi:hypothetical protein
MMKQVLGIIVETKYSTIYTLLRKLIYFLLSLLLLASNSSKKTTILVIIVSSSTRKQHRMMKPIPLVALTRVRRSSSLTSDLNNHLTLRCSFDFLTRNAMRVLKSIQASAGKNGHENFLLSRSKPLTPHYPAICRSTTLLMNTTTRFNPVSDTTSLMPKLPYFPMSISPSLAQLMINSLTRLSIPNMCQGLDLLVQQIGLGLRLLPCAPTDHLCPDFRRRHKAYSKMRTESPPERGH